MNKCWEGRSIPPPNRKRQHPYGVLKGISFNECVANAHIVMDDIRYKIVSKSDLVNLDGMPMEWKGCFAGLITLSRNTFTA